MAFIRGEWERMYNYSSKSSGLSANRVYQQVYWEKKFISFGMHLLEVRDTFSVSRGWRQMAQDLLEKCLHYLQYEICYRPQELNEETYFFHNEMSFSLFRRKHPIILRRKTECGMWRLESRDRHLNLVDTFFILVSACMQKWSWSLGGQKGQLNLQIISKQCFKG